jgi:hypothetical protein
MVPVFASAMLQRIRTFLLAGMIASGPMSKASDRDVKGLRQMLVGRLSPEIRISVAPSKGESDLKSMVGLVDALPCP